MNDLSVFDLFRTGVGPSSSHTVGPMRAARQFLESIPARFPEIARVRTDLFGSLAATGKGHATDLAIILGLSGRRPESIEPGEGERLLAAVNSTRSIHLLGAREIAFDTLRDIRFRLNETLPDHPNGMRFSGTNAGGITIATSEVYSIGGGFLLPDAEYGSGLTEGTRFPYRFANMEELLSLCARHRLTMAEILFANECSVQPPDEVRSRLLSIWATMRKCIERGLNVEGTLPGSLRVRRRAKGIRQMLEGRQPGSGGEAMDAMAWVSVYAMAVNEENAAGGRVVTAPTNGAAGVIPAVLRYRLEAFPEADDESVVSFLLVAGGVGAIVKLNASISGAECGCQGEIGTACAMAAAGLAASLGGTPLQVENAAEIAMEHNLGLTCDPVAGLVQIPCIERNGLAAVKAISAASLAINGNGVHRVSFDQAVETMRQTGNDMKSKYKETSMGGLAVNVVEC